MPILLTTPETIHGGHGQPDQTYSCVRICAFNFVVSHSRMVISLQYGDVVDGKWVTEAPEFRLPAIQDTPAQMTDGVDANGGWVEAEAVPASTVFSDMVTGFVIAAGDTGERGYDVVAEFLYGWLISNGYYVGAVL